MTMYSGKEGIEYPTGWALNPMAYQHLPSEQVDWAALAQQWIQMKETCPPAAMSIAAQPPPPPPPPVISSQSDAEGGEAPMDVEGGDGDAPAPPVIPPHQWNSNTSGWDNNTWNSQWANNWGWPQNSSGSSKTPHLPASDLPYQGYTTGDNNLQGYTSTNNTSQSGYSGEYWSGDDSNSETKSRLPMRGNRFSPNRQGLGSRRGGIHLQRQNQMQMANEVPDTTQTIDAAKRKQLPAWIREGLEKMEREKQKQVDRERERREREEYLKMKKLEEEKSLEESQPNDGMPRMPVKSKFDSDSEKSDNEDKELDREINKIDKKIKVQIHHVAPPPLLKRSQDEIMKDLMLNVRRTLTEILLEVTDDQIHNIAKEELSRVRSHSQASRGVSVTSKLQGLSAIGGGLGLGMYGDSSNSESESEADSRSTTPDTRRQRERTGDVTDGQLQEAIRRRKAEFEKTSREIELRIAEEERAEQQKAKRDIPSRTPPQRSRSSSAGSHEREKHHNGSDGENTTTNSRKERNVIDHKKSSKDRDGSSPSTEISRRHTPEKSHKDRHATDKNNKSYDSKKHAEKFSKKSKKKSNGASDSSSSEDNSNSEDSFLNKKGSDSASESSSSSDSSQKSSSKSESDSFYRRSKKKRRRSSDDSVKDKKHKSKPKKERSKSEKESNKFTTEETSSRKKHYVKDESETRDSRISSRNSGHSPDRKSYKSKNRSRSRSDDRRNRKFENSSKYDSYKSRDRSRDRTSYSREYRSRSRDRDRVRKKRDHSRDYRSRSRDRRSKSRERRERYSRERRGRSREGRRDRRGESRSYYY